MIVDRRRLIRAGLASPALLIPTLALAEQFAGVYRPQAELIADGVWIVRGADEPIAFANGGAIANSAILATNDGPMLFDPGVSREHGLALGALALNLCGKPVARVYISHLHPDHALGAAAFPPQIVHALPATRAELERDGNGFADAMYRILADWMKGTAIALPQGDLAEGEIVIGGRHIRLMALDGHSGGDLALLDKASGVLLAGDLVFHNRAPTTPHADLAKWRLALDRLAATPHSVLLPGHGPLDRDGSAIRQTRDWLDWLEPALQQAVMQGLDMTEAGEIPIPSRFESMAAARYELQRSVSHLYPAFEAELLPRL
ncbi:MAG: quinoprotein relay system zinc metallohydrolase 1 [Novosphingobium sp.]|uniref:quinoprotein relay system zinc metallohydrolase 1 n=1 Tax=Novosphingobium sp. TaxID=1874826 RepID=UPI003B9C3492